MGLLNNKHTSISHFALSQRSHRILHTLLIHRPSHDHGPNIMRNSKLKHLPHLPSWRNGRSLNSQPTGNEGKGWNFEFVEADGERKDGPAGSHEREVPKEVSTLEPNLQTREVGTGQS